MPSVPCNIMRGDDRFSEEGKRISGGRGASDIAQYKRQGIVADPGAELL
jgi:hypothetical protein